MTKKRAEILSEYGPFPGADHVHGVSYDGQNVWIAVGNRLLAIAPDGTPGRSLAVRAEAGTAFDGRHLYQIAGGRIQKVDPSTGEVVAIVPAPANTDYAGLTWAEGALWVAEYQGRRIHKLDPETGRVVRTVPSDRLVTGVTFAEGGAVEDGQAEIRRVDPSSGEVLESLTLPEGAFISGLESDGHGRLYAGGGFVSGLEYDGESRFYAGGGRSGRLRVVRRPKR